MFMQRESFSNDTLTEFSPSVESIMRCEDFKSNFARRLSNRYISRSPSIGRKRDQQQSPKLPVPNKKPLSAQNVPERIESSPQLSPIQKTDLNDEVPQLPADLTTNKQEDKKSIEVSILNMKVETLKWQLAQTETNRQMHLALLKRVVSFLNRVKEHMERQSQEATPSKRPSPPIFPRTTKTNLPRSRSVLLFNKNLDYTCPEKKPNTMKLSKSITNVNGFKDNSYSIWNQSKLILDAEMDTGQKITEEISRFISLANTVLSTTIPDLTYSCTDNSHNVTNIEKELNVTDIETIQDKIIDENIHNVTASKINPVTVNLKDSSTTNNSVPVELSYETDVGIELQEKISTNAKNDLSIVKSIDITTGSDSNLNRESIFVEDESGFSSMSSFQEIGIPIINIIPPSPCKEDAYPENRDLVHETEEWLTTPLNIDNRGMKVFWV